MEKGELKRALTASVNGAELMTPKQLGRFLGKEKDYVRDFCRGMDCIGSGRGKMYFVGDIAERLMSLRTLG